MTSAAAALGTLPPAKPAPLKQDAAVIGLVGLAHGTSHFSHMLLAPLFPVFIRDFGLGFADVGLLMTVFFVISGIGQAASGFLVDRVGARPVLFAAISCFLAASLVASQATGYWGLMAVAVLAGIGNAPFHPCDFTILNQRVSNERLGHAFSVHGVTGSLGWALAPVFLVGITSLSDWRTAYYSAALLYLGVLALLWWQRDKLLTQVVVRAPAESGAPAGKDLDFLKLPVVWWCFAFFLLSTMTLAVVQSFVPSILQAVYGTSMEAATLTVSAYMLCSAVGMFVGGFVAVYGQRRQISSDTVLAWGMGLGALLMLLCATGWFGEVGTMVVLAITGFALGVAGPSRDLLIKRATPKGATGRVYGTVYSGLDVGFALSPLVFGVLMDHGWYAATLAGGAVVLALSAYAALGVGKRVAA
ncbi:MULTISPECIES: MFS transporter [Hydrogenophaga]|uniref:Major facilitator transporter n=1 Tax=Hydrogenophaga intermedia TaxID=65786 RepID=A0A1L1PHC9_HYDIT|nr:MULTISPECIES: MFS transporter [Hydrogenophaga]AOS79038.1 MFS transporter [Hydrogenophaga sp. PBC]TMU74569.1 MFS transporter [Hydrogenophaga intermedia]CDN88184.1 Major facilitator transporter [Hydrogenophaga intermedia]